MPSSQSLSLVQETRAREGSPYSDSSRRVNQVSIPMASPIFFSD